MSTAAECLDVNAVIVGADHPTGLGTGRALVNEGINLVGLCSTTISPYCRSRIWNKIIITSINSDHFLNNLIAIGRNIVGQKVLFPCQDSIVQVVSQNRDILKQYFEFVLPEKSSVNMLLDKTSFHEWASKHGFMVPDSYVAESYHELESILNKATYPVILKPFVRTELWDQVSPNNKVIKLNDKKDVEYVNFDIFDVSPKVLIQQWIPGRDTDVHFCLEYFDRKGRELAYYTGRKIFQWPIGFGSTAAAIGNVNNEIHEITKAVFRKAEFCGLGSLEFRQNQIDKEYYIIEPTVGRNDLQSFVSVAGGVNITKIAFFDAIGSWQKTSSIKQQKGVWIAEEPLLDAIRSQQKANLFKYKELFQLVAGKKSFAIFDIKDPMPFLVFVFHKLKNKLSL